MREYLSGGGEVDVDFDFGVVMLMLMLILMLTDRVVETLCMFKFTRVLHIVLTIELAERGEPVVDGLLHRVLANHVEAADFPLGVVVHFDEVWLSLLSRLGCLLHACGAG